jgi:hypothetical protein
MANNVVLFGKINQKEVDRLFGSVITEKFPPQLRKLIADGQVCARVKLDSVELHRGEIENDELGKAVSQIFEFCDEITMTPNKRPEELTKQSKPASKPTGLELEM